MNVPLYLLTVAHLICAAAGAQPGSLESQLLEEGIRSGRRTCRLYCRVGIGFHLQIHPDGRVNGSHEPNRLSKSFIRLRAAGDHLNKLRYRSLTRGWIQRVPPRMRTLDLRP